MQRTDEALPRWGVLEGLKRTEQAKLLSVFCCLLFSHCRSLSLSIYGVPRSLMLKTARTIERELTCEIDPYCLLLSLCISACCWFTNCFFSMLAEHWKFKINVFSVSPTRKAHTDSHTGASRSFTHSPSRSLAHLILKRGVKCPFSPPTASSIVSLLMPSVAAEIFGCGRSRSLGYSA